MKLKLLCNSSFQKRPLLVFLFVQLILLEFAKSLSFENTFIVFFVLFSFEIYNFFTVTVLWY